MKLASPTTLPSGAPRTGREQPPRDRDAQDAENDAENGRVHNRGVIGGTGAEAEGRRAEEVGRPLLDACGVTSYLLVMPSLRGRRAVKLRVGLSKVALAACLIVASAFTGCASLGPHGTVPEFTEKSRCEGNGDVWYSNLGLCSRV